MIEIYLCRGSRRGPGELEIKDPYEKLALDVAASEMTVVGRSRAKATTKGRRGRWSGKIVHLR